MFLPLRRLVFAATAACAAIAATAVSSSVLATANAVSRPPTVPLTSATCGSTVLYKSDGTPWSCTFDDEFTSTALDTTHWTAENSGANGYSSGIDCYSPKNVTFNGNELVLTASRLARATPCLGTKVTTQYVTGMLTSQNHFSQAYGRFEMRARLPSGTGLHPAFWMIPANPLRDGSYEYGEIDIAEAYGSYPNYVSPHLHYVTTPGTASNGATCYVRNTKFVDHTYTVEWTPTQMTFRYDGNTCWTTTWAPAPPYAPANATSPTPFDQPFYMMVQLAVDGPSVPYNAVSSGTFMPAKMYVDYVRAWQ